ncbi:MAG: adenylosuccinate lyase [Coxiella sp. RIFCSPHIGHO2_12_FULL_44_14]|nr:MAG: adenylosuccinate lyase [Coxiella sp. RIFCSPHIGHO2_12_FULL_44_14]
MELSPLTALSPLDGRYQQKLTELRPILSEYGLFYYRVFVEIRWLIFLADHPDIREVPSLNKETRHQLEQIIQNFSLSDVEQIKAIEKTTQHDLKAVEYFIRQHCQANTALSPFIPFIHFACTSEDINNVAYSLMLTEAKETALLPRLRTLLQTLTQLAHRYAETPMLARTHGQPASPTTLGKECANFVARLKKEYHTWRTIQLTGKWNGAVGNFNAHQAAYPTLPWEQMSRDFIVQFHLEYNEYTTQIEPHDRLAEWLQIAIRLNNILIDLNRDLWGYISLNYLQQKAVETETGSSTMPHKINPIDFENSEGNLGLANALATHFVNKLPISRWQRDLTDSTVLRNLGSFCGYSLLAYQHLLQGLHKITANEERIRADLDSHWEVLAEAIQTVMRRHGITESYERLKELTRGRTIDATIITRFIDDLPLPPEAKVQLRTLTPHNYLGAAVSLARKISDNGDKEQDV